MTSTITAKEALRSALRSLLARRWTAGAALLGGAAGALAERAATTSTRLVIARGGEGAGWRAAALLLVGGAIFALVSAWSRTGAVAAATGTPARELVRAAVQRGIATISLGAVELTVIGTLVLFAAVDTLAVMALARGPAISSLAIAFACAPPLFLALIALSAFRIGAALTAAGVPSHRALADGLAVTFRRLPALLGFALVAAVATAPLWLGALALANLGSRDLAVALRVPAIAASGALAVAAWAWGHAALGRFAAPESSGRISAERS